MPFRAANGERAFLVRGAYMGKIFTNDPPFYQQLRAIAIPVAVQNLITVGVSMLDTLMLGSMGEVQLSASSLQTSGSLCSP